MAKDTIFEIRFEKNGEELTSALMRVRTCPIKTVKDALEFFSRPPFATEYFMPSDVVTAFEQQNGDVEPDVRGDSVEFTAKVGGANYTIEFKEAEVIDCD